MERLSEDMPRVPKARMPSGQIASLPDGGMFKMTISAMWDNKPMWDNVGYPLES